MESFELKTYDAIEDRSPFYCGGGGVLLGVMAWREYSTTGELGLRLWSMLLVMVIFAVVAVRLLQRYRVITTVSRDSEGREELRICSWKGAPQVILESQLAYVKQEKGRVMVHYYEGEDLRRTAIPSKGGSKRAVAKLVEILEQWQV